MKNAILLLFCAISFASCSVEGCTDPNAPNYNSLATKDNGTCIKCLRQGPFQFNEGNPNYVYDFQTGSPYYNQNIVKVTSISTRMRYPDESCGKDSCEIGFTIESLIDRPMQLNIVVRSQYSSDFVLDINLPPHGIYTEPRLKYTPAFQNGDKCLLGGSATPYLQSATYN